MKKFSVWTINVWGLPFGISPDKRKRIESIGRAIAESNCDVICLQELWTKDDFIIIKTMVERTHPYHHNFYSGITGSGLCIFSKWMIKETFYYAFPVNGFFHMVHHGDWFGGKGIGLAHIDIHGVKVYVYNTHLHADYSDSGGVKDSYFAHRLVQAFDTALFIKHTSGCADVTILAGDLNCELDDLCARLICGLANLEDTWEVAETKEVFPETNDCYRNMYRNKKLPHSFPGRRLDNILFKTNKKHRVTIYEWKFPLEEIIPGTKISYSDHEAVCASFHTSVTSTPKEGSDHSSNEEVKKTLLEGLNISMELCRVEVQGHKSDINTFLFVMLLLVAVMVILPHLVDNHIIINVFFIVATGILCFLIALTFTRWQDMFWFKNAKKRLKIYVKEIMSDQSD